MGNRDKLLEGALRCLQTKGYGRTTARDIAAVAGANVASINYHFGSKETLLNEAIGEGFRRWTRQVGEAVLAQPVASAPERLRLSLVETITAFEPNRPLLVAFVEAMAQAERSPAVREQLASYYRESRAATAALIKQSLSDTETSTLNPTVAASTLLAVLDGLILQWLLDPNDAPSGDQVADTLEQAATLASAVTSR